MTPDEFYEYSTLLSVDKDLAFQWLEARINEIPPVVSVQLEVYHAGEDIPVLVPYYVN